MEHAITFLKDGLAENQPLGGAAHLKRLPIATAMAFGSIVDNGGNTHRTLFTNSIGEKLGAVRVGILRLRRAVANTCIKSR